MSILTFEPESVPLRNDEGGVVRVGNSRVSLDSVIREFRNGSDPEEIVRAYDTLKLADVYAAIFYYLRHKDQVDAYIERRRGEAQKLRAEIEAAQPDRTGFRERLLARQALREQEHTQHASSRE